MKTWQSKPGEIKRQWWLLDATDRPLGRLATRVSQLLRGKLKAGWTPHVDTGDFVVIINAKNIYLSGKKWGHKKYFSHSGFFGSLKEKTARELPPARLIEEAVWGMLPKNKMRHKLMRKLKIYEEGTHPHGPQKPKAFSLDIPQSGSSESSASPPQKPPAAAGSSKTA